MNKKLLSLYSLKFNPFSPDVPIEALWVPPVLDSLLENRAANRRRRLALAIGELGSGKPAGLRVLRARLSGLRDVTVGVLTVGPPAASAASDVQATTVQDCNQQPPVRFSLHCAGASPCGR